MAASDAKPVPLKNTAFRVYFDVVKNDGTLITTWAGQDSEASLDGGNFADCTNEATEIQTSGIGYLDLTAAEMNADMVIVKVTVTNTGALPVRLFLYPVESTDIPVNMTAVSGDTVAADRLESQYDGTGLTGDTYPATQAALQTVDDELEIVSGYALTASSQSTAANAKFGSGITSAAGQNLDDWLAAMAADGATAPTAMSSAGFDPTTDSLEAIRNRGDAAWVTGGGASVQNIFEADPADYDADSDSFAARVLAILAKANQITGPFAYKGPVSTTGRVTIYQGKDYNSNDGTALEWTSDSALTGLDAVGASVSFDINGDQYAGVVSGSVGAWTIRVNLTAAQTAALPVGDSPYELTAVLASGRTPPPLAVGTVTVKAEV